MYTEQYTYDFHDNQVARDYSMENIENCTKKRREKNSITCSAIMSLSQLRDTIELQIACLYGTTI